MGYDLGVIEVRKTEKFERWQLSLKDKYLTARVLARISRLSEGNPGDVRPVGSGVSEMRIDYGPGYRIYYMQRGTEIILLLAGGSKKTQEKDIKLALELAQL